MTLKYLRYELKKRERKTTYWVVLGCVLGIFGSNYFDHPKNAIVTAIFFSFLATFVYTLVEYSLFFRSGHGYLIFGSPKLKGMCMVFGRILIFLFDIILYLVAFTIIEVLLNIIFRPNLESILVKDAVNMSLKVFTSFKVFKIFLLLGTSFFLLYLFIFMTITFSNTILKRLNSWLSRLITIIMVIVAVGLFIYSFVIPQLQEDKTLMAKNLFWLINGIHVLIMAVIVLVCSKVIDKNLNL